MPIQIIEQNIISGQATTFKFTGKVLKKVVGIRWLELYMSDAHVKLLKVALSVNQNADDEVNVRADVALSDGQSSDELDRSKSQIFVNVIAWIAPDVSSVMMQNVDGLSSEVRSRPLTLPSRSTTIFQSFLSGLDMTFSDDDHHVATIAAGVGTEQDQSTGYLTGSATLADSGGHSAKASFDGGVIASSDANPGFSVQIAGSGEHELTFPAGIKSVWPLLQSFQAAYSYGDNHLQFLQVGGWTSSGPDADGKACVMGACWMGDGKGNREDPSKTSVGLVVIGA